GYTYRHRGFTQSDIGCAGWRQDRGGCAPCKWNTSDRTGVFTGCITAQRSADGALRRTHLCEVLSPSTSVNGAVVQRFTASVYPTFFVTIFIVVLFHILFLAPYFF